MFCSILIITRFRLPGLRTCIESFINNASGHTDFEFIVRCHHDDPETLAEIPRMMEQYPNLKFIVGKNYDGFISLGKFYDEAALLAVGKFTWLLNDDELVEGPWYDRLKEAPENALIKPEIYQLNASRYTGCGNQGQVCTKNKMWREIGWADGIVLPVDTPFYDLFVKENGLPLHFLPGVNGRHNRVADRTCPNP